MVTPTTEEERTCCVVMAASPLWPLQIAEPGDDPLREDRPETGRDAPPDAVTG